MNNKKIKLANSEEKTKVLLMNMPSTIRVYGKSALKGIIAPRP